MIKQSGNGITPYRLSKSANEDKKRNKILQVYAVGDAIARYQQSAKASPSSVMDVEADWANSAAFADRD